MKTIVLMAALVGIPGVAGGDAQGEGAQSTPAYKIGDVLARLDLRQVEVGGEFGRRIDLTVKGNLLKIDIDKDFLEPFSGGKYTGINDGSGPFIGLGKTLDGMVRLAASTRDEALVARKNHVVDSILKSQGSDGYIGLMPPERRTWTLWELHDEALMNCDLGQVIFALCVLGVRDMEFLWKQLAVIARRHGVICAGDTACGFGNTAMVLAEQKMIPRVFAAVVRAVTAVRTLVAYEHGAVGPGKDCAYENPYLKAITGYPVAMEGKTSACAHFSPLGNIAAAYADTWSNESVQNVRLLAGMAPTCYMEQLIYDCRLMNRALAEGKAAALTLRRWLVESDAGLDPQAWVLTPKSVMAIARAIVNAPNHYQAGVAAGRCAVDLLRAGHAAGSLKIAPREVGFLDSMTAQLDKLPSDEAAFIARQMSLADSTKYLPAEYGL